MADIRQLLKSRFKKGQYPTEQDFANLIDNMLLRGEKLGMGDIESLNDALNKKAPADSLKSLQTVENEIKQAKLQLTALSDQYYRPMLPFSGDQVSIRSYMGSITLPPQTLYIPGVLDVVLNDNGVWLLRSIYEIKTDTTATDLQNSAEKSATSQVYYYHEWSGAEGIASSEWYNSRKCSYYNYSDGYLYFFDNADNELMRVAGTKHVIGLNKIITEHDAGEACVFDWDDTYIQENFLGEGRDFATVLAKMAEADYIDGLEPPTMIVRDDHGTIAQILQYVGEWKAGASTGKGDPRYNAANYEPLSLASLHKVLRQHAAEIKVAESKSFIDQWITRCNLYGNFGGFDADTMRGSLNGLTDLTLEEMRKIDAAGVSHNVLANFCRYNSKIRTVYPIAFVNSSNQVDLSEAFHGCDSLEAVRFIPAHGVCVTLYYTFNVCPKLHSIYGLVIGPNFKQAGDNSFKTLPNLVTIELTLKNITAGATFNFEQSSKLSYESLEWIVSKAETQSKGVTFTMHPDVYAKLSGDTSNAAAKALLQEDREKWQALIPVALAKNISFATV